MGDTFNNGAIVVGSGQLAAKPFGLVGHQNVAFTWTNKERLSLEQDPSNIARLLLQERFPLLGNPGPGPRADPRAIFSRSPSRPATQP